MTQAMFSRTGSDQFPSYLKCMISGPPKSGKTTLLGTVPNLLVLDTEPHANNLQSIAHLDVPFKTIYSTDDLRQAQFILSQDGFRQQAAQGLGMPAIEGVAIDTIDTLQAIMKRERMKEQRSTKFVRDDWGWLKEEMTSILESFLALPMHVFFIVHTKSENVGTEDSPRTIILPGLEGAIARQIAGMVGYSLLSFRKEEIKPDGSGKFTKYWLRAEGDETYEYLGNRAAGRLPDVIEPDFAELLKAAMMNRPTNQQAPVNIQFGQLPQGATQPPALNMAQAPNAATFSPVQAQQTGNGWGEQQQPNAVAQVQGQPAQAPQAPTEAPTGVPQALPADSEPVNIAALGHVKRIYDACQIAFPEDKIKALNLGQARDLVRMFKAVSQDDAEGKTPEGQTAPGIMVEYLAGQNLLSDAAPVVEKEVEPKIDGTIEQVKAYVGDDLARANEAFELERSGKNRKGLMEWLESKGASHGGHGQVQTAPVQTPVENPAPPVAPVEAAPEAPAHAPEPVQEPAPAVQPAVTPEPPAVDNSSTEEQAAVALLEEKLGAVELISPDSICEECKNQIDDVDLAQLGKSRFGRVLCVGDYIAETKKK